MPHGGQEEAFPLVHKQQWHSSMTRCPNVIKIRETVELHLTGTAFEVTNHKKEAFPLGLQEGDCIAVSVLAGRGTDLWGFHLEGTKPVCSCHLSVKLTSFSTSTQLRDRPIFRAFNYRMENTSSEKQLRLGRRMDEDTILMK